MKSEGIKVSFIAKFLLISILFICFQCGMYNTERSDSLHNDNSSEEIEEEKQNLLYIFLLLK